MQGPVIQQAVRSGGLHYCDKAGERGDGEIVLSVIGYQCETIKSRAITAVLEAGVFSLWLSGLVTTTTYSSVKDVKSLKEVVGREVIWLLYRNLLSSKQSQIILLSHNDARDRDDSVDIRDRRARL